MQFVRTRLMAGVKTGGATIQAKGPCKKRLGDAKPALARWGGEKRFLYRAGVGLVWSVSTYEGATHFNETLQLPRFYPLDLRDLQENT